MFFFVFLLQFTMREKRAGMGRTTTEALKLTATLARQRQRIYTRSRGQ
jgi:hypothetical protein